MKKAVIITLIVMAAAACLLLFLKVNPDMAKRMLVPTVEDIEHLSVRITGDTAFSSLRVRLKNEGWFTMTTDTIRCSIFLDSIRLMKERAPFPLRLRPGDTVSRRVAFRVSVANVKKAVLQVQSRDSALVHVDAEIGYSTWIGHRTLEYSRSRHIAVPRVPEFTLEKVKLLGIRRGHLQLLITVNMHNRGQMDFTLRDFRYRIEIKDRVSANGVLPGEIVLHPRSHITRDLPLEAKLTHLPATILNIITDNDTYPYTLHLSGTVETNEGEIFPVDLVTDGVTELRKK